MALIEFNPKGQSTEKFKSLKAAQQRLAEINAATVGK